MTYDRWEDPPTGHARRRTGGERLRSAFVLVVTGLAMAMAVALFAPNLVPAPLAGRLGLEPQRLGEPPAVTGTGTYKFIAFQRGKQGAPVAYDPCREIHVVLNPAQGPDEAEELVKRAIDIVGAATGLRFVYDGISDDRPRWSGPMKPAGFGRSDPVLVSFATPDEVPELGGRVAGIGGSTALTDNFGRTHYVSGQVTLDAQAFESVLRRSSGIEQADAIMLHEFGHLVGLDHVTDPQELMYAENVGRIEFGTGDRIGLAELGRGDCFWGGAGGSALRLPCMAPTIRGPASRPSSRRALRLTGWATYSPRITPAASAIVVAAAAESCRMPWVSPSDM